MKKMKFAFLIVFLLFALSLKAQNDSSSVRKMLSNTEISGQWFVAYTHSDYDSLAYFQLKRGYLDIKTKINSNFSVRYTQDITIDKEGSDAGNIETRMKYMYLKAKLNDFAFINGSYLELGMAHRPWVDFDGKINPYRLQDEMFVDRNKIINSADLGISWIGLLGGEVDDDYKKNVSSAYPGRYGSFAVGLFNGGGYSALENNSNKTIETRLTLRPLPDRIPGLLLTHSLAYGLANVADYKALFLLNIFALTYQCRYFLLHGQYYRGMGGHQMHFVSPGGTPYANEGYSVLGEIKIPATSLSLFSRYDLLNSEKWLNTSQTLVAGGLAYSFSKSKIAAYFEQSDYESHTENLWELALEIKF